MEGTQAQFENLKQLNWPAPPAGWVLEDQEIHVWAAWLRHDRRKISDFAATLAPEETMRAARFKFDLHRDRFVAGRGILRVILSRYLGVPPSNLVFGYGKCGKPSLASPNQRTPLFFNLAHSDDLLVVAVTRSGEVGVDVERIRQGDELAGIVESYFAPSEKAVLRDSSMAENPQAFFNLWTRKEALHKATGDGIGSSLSQVDVSSHAGGSAGLFGLCRTGIPTEEWRVCDLAPPAPEFVGALAAKSKSFTLCCWQWKNQPRPNS